MHRTTEGQFDKTLRNEPNSPGPVTPVRWCSRVCNSDAGSSRSDHGGGAARCPTTRNTPWRRSPAGSGPRMARIGADRSPRRRGEPGCAVGPLGGGARAPGGSDRYRHLYTEECGWLSSSPRVSRMQGRCRSASRTSPPRRIRRHQDHQAVPTGCRRPLSLSTEGAGEPAGKTTQVPQRSSS